MQWSCLLLGGELWQAVEQDVVFCGDGGQASVEGHGQAVGDAARVPVLVSATLTTGNQGLAVHTLGRAGLPHSQHTFS